MSIIKIMKTIMDENSITRTLVRMTHEIIEKNKGVENLVLVGIKTRGETIAHRIAQNIKRFEGVDIETVGFDIRYWRDDIDKTGITKPNYDLDLNHKIVVLIDDVLYKGRTVRAAMDGVMSFGRPQSIQLAVLVDRGHRELPIRADVVGKNVPTSTEESVKVSLQEVDGSDEVIILERND
jgi:pyrimidine operon attenuation protein / uracil phosphoribosyltransferase